MRNRPGAAALVVLSFLFASALLVGRSAAATSPVAIVAEYDGIIHPIAAEFIDEVITRADQRGADGDRHRAPHAGRTARVYPCHRVADDRRPRAGRGVRRPGRWASRVGRIPHHVGCRRGGDGARHAHRRRAPGFRWWRATRRLTRWRRRWRPTPRPMRGRLPETRGKNAALAAEAVTESRAFTAHEALAAAPRLIDLVAARRG